MAVYLVFLHKPKMNYDTAYIRVYCEYSYKGIFFNMALFGSVSYLWVRTIF